MHTTSWFFWSGRPAVGTLPTESEINDATRFAAAVLVQRAFKTASRVRGLESRRASAALLMTSTARGLVARRRVRQDTQDLVWELFENSIDDETPTRSPTAPRRASKAFRVVMLAACVLLLAGLHGHVLAGRSGGAAKTTSQNVTQPMKVAFLHLLDVAPQPNHEINLKKKSAQSASVQEAITSISQETAHALAQYVNDSLRETSVAAIGTVQEAITISQETAHALAQYVNDSIRETRSTAAATMRQEKIQVLAHLNAAKRVVIMSVQEIGRYLIGLVTGASDTAIKAAEWLKVVLKEQVNQAGRVSRVWHKAVGALLKDTEIFFA